MKHEVVEPDDAKLTALLRQCRPAAPPLPPGFQQAVWRRIQRDQAQSPATEWVTLVDQLVDWLLRPRWTLACITVLVLMGGLAGALSSTAAAKQAARERYLAVVAPNQVR